MLQLGQIIHDRYRIDTYIARGGFGAVYRAWDQRLHQQIALKENLHLNPESQRQFEREAILLANLRHPNLPRVIDHFNLPNQGQYLVLDFIEGRSLADLLQERGRPFTETDIVPWIVQVCDALTYLHSRQPPIIHRDIKPNNIIITPESQAVLVDFGIAKVYESQGVTSLGAKGITHGFSPPEQYIGTTEARSDIYALGATLYNLLTGQPPPPSIVIKGETFIEQPHKLNPALRPKTEAVIMKAMSFAREDRFTTTSDLKTALAEVIMLPKPPAAPAPTPTFWQRLPIWFYGLGIVVLAGLAFWGGGQVMGGGNQSDRNGDNTSAATLAQVATETNFVLAELSTETATRQPEPSNTPTHGATPVDITRPQVNSTVTRTPTALPSLTPPPSASPTTRATSTPSLEAGDTQVITLPGSLEVTQVYVPAGQFVMGSYPWPRAGVYSNEFPAHRISLEAFWIDQTEVTNEQFASFLNEEENQEEEGVMWFNQEAATALIQIEGSFYQPKNGYQDYPVVEVNWYGARAYCEWTGGRLPTEAEWEYAARGPDGFIYPWGDRTGGCARANIPGCFGGLTRVGHFQERGASWVGALDMIGNVREWINDWYASEYYQDSPDENPLGPETGTARVIRGGSWEYSGDDAPVRAAKRTSGSPGYSGYDIGFRCVHE